MSNVFIGDSVTDCSRLTIPPYGNGWVNEIASSGVIDDVINVGINGNRLIDLEARWQKDVYRNNPTRLTIDVGVNDTCRRYDSNDPTDVKDFEIRYDRLLSETTNKFHLEIVLCEPFLIIVRPEMTKWREDLDPKIEIVHKMANKYKAKLVKFDEMFKTLTNNHPEEIFSEDGVHPSLRGHQEMAKLWRKVVLELG